MTYQAQNPAEDPAITQASPASVAPEHKAPTNTARTALIIIGIVLLIGGAILGIASSMAGEHAARVDQYAAALSGYRFDTASEHFMRMWVGIVSAGVGALILLGVLFLSAAKRPQP